MYLPATITYFRSPLRDALFNVVVKDKLYSSQLSASQATSFVCYLGLPTSPVNKINSTIYSIYLHIKMALARLGGTTILIY